MTRLTASARQFLIGDDLWEKLRCRRRPGRNNAGRFGGGWPREDDRACADAIFLVPRTGCQRGHAGRAAGLCPHSAAHDRFLEWRRPARSPAVRGRSCARSTPRPASMGVFG